MFWAILYALLLILLVVGYFAGKSDPRIESAQWIVLYLLLGIVGFVLFRDELRQ